jgi:hypothetical protein
MQPGGRCRLLHAVATQAQPGRQLHPQLPAMQVHTFTMTISKGADAGLRTAKSSVTFKPINPVVRLTCHAGRHCTMQAMNKLLPTCLKLGTAVGAADSCPHRHNRAQLRQRRLPREAQDGLAAVAELASGCRL